MNRTIFSLLVLLLFGLFSQPSIAQSRQHASQRNAVENAARMSEAEMRAHLPHAKERLKMSQRALNTGNYSEYYVGDDAIGQGVAKAAAEAEYYYYTTLINEIEKRLSKIDSQKPKPQIEQQQEETEQQPQEILGRTSEQVQADLQQSFDEAKKKSQPRFDLLHTNVEASSKATREGNVALNSVISNTDPNSRRVTGDMLDKQLSPTSKTNSGKRDGSIGISSKFNNKPKETKEESEETSNEYKEILELIYKLD